MSRNKSRVRSTSTEGAKMAILRFASLHYFCAYCRVFICLNVCQFLHISKNPDFSFRLQLIEALMKNPDSYLYVEMFTLTSEKRVMKTKL